MYMKLKSFVTVGVACVGLAALAGTFASSAVADPPAISNSVVTSGSDTTQDVLNGIAKTIGGTPQTIGSWDAFTGLNPIHTHGLITPKSTAACTNISRPNGSGDGVNSLRRAKSGTTGFPASSAQPMSHLSTDDVATPVSTPLGSLCWDAARSSSGPAANVVDSTGGLLQFVPFALDAVSASTGPTGTTHITNANSFTTQNLKDLYTCHAVTVGTITYTPDGGAGTTPIHLYVPQAGSGTRSFWASTLGFNGTTLPTCVHDTSEVDGTSVQEHDGTVVAADPDGIAPFSIAQWIAQFNHPTGVTDRRHGAVLHTLDSVTPTVTGSGGSTLLNTAYPIKREVFNVIPQSAVASGLLHNLFVTTSSQVCSDSTDIQKYGFGLLSSTTPHLCGAVDSALRAFGPSTF